MDFEEIEWEGVVQLNLAQGRDQWQVLLNIVMNLQGSIKGKEFIDKENDLVSEEGLCIPHLIHRHFLIFMAKSKSSATGSL